MGPIERKIRQSITRGMILYTIPGGAKFKVEALLSDALNLLFGAKETRTRFKWKDLESIPGSLPVRGG